MRSIIGAKARSRNSKGGANGLCVPPRISNRDGSDAVSIAGKTVCKTNVALPALPTSKR